MTTPTISIDFFLEKLAGDLGKSFPEEQFLEEELDGVMQAVVNIIRLSTLKKAKEDAEGGLIRRPAERLETIDHFSTKWVPREDLLFCIENTSGLPDYISEQALKVIETTTDNLTAANSKIVIEHIGALQSTGEGGYVIELAKELLIKPSELKRMIASRTATANS